MLKYNFILIILLKILLGNVLANDTTAIVTPLGIEYQKNNHIRIKQEILKISLEKIEVSYIFFNESDKEITLDVAFPLPPAPIDNSIRVFPEWDEAYHAYRLLEDNPGSLSEGKGGSNISLKKSLSKAAFVNFRHWINDQEYGFNYKIIARAPDGKDITQLLKTHKIPISATFLNGHMDAPALAFHPEWKKILKKLNLLTKDGEANWQNQTIYFWQMTFPPKQDIKVRHSYRPHPGHFYLEPKDIKSPFEEIKFYHRDLVEKSWDQFCPSIEFKNKILEKLTENQEYKNFYTSQLDYILTTANNWKGPIEYFKLEVNIPQNYLISSCFPLKKKEGEKGILLYEAKNFVPTFDLKILFLNLDEALIIKK